GRARWGCATRGQAPRSPSRTGRARPRTAVGGRATIRTGGTTQVHRLRTARLAALLVGLAMVAAGCGGGDDDSGGTSGGSTTALKGGGTPTYASDQEQAGFNPNTAKDNLFALSSIVTGIYPSVFNIHPDFTVQLDNNFMDSAELTSEDPQTVVYKIKQEAV